MLLDDLQIMAAIRGLLVIDVGTLRPDLGRQDQSAGKQDGQGSGAEVPHAGEHFVS
jgi:hypothetical protein